MLFDKVVRISEEFLGPAGERFMRRQITTHLHIKPEKLQTKHLKDLVEWVRLTFAVLTDDQEEVQSFSDRLLDLADKKTKKAYAKVG